LLKTKTLFAAPGPLKAAVLCSLIFLGSLFVFAQDSRGGTGNGDPARPDIVLQGVITGAQNRTYLEAPFDVPAGVHRISVDFSYTGRADRTTLDVGIADPERFRGNSGGNKSHFTIGETDATPSYFPGSIPPGKWKLLISVPNIRTAEKSSYRAEIRFNSPVEDRGFALVPLATGMRWYRGDLHMHTAHSDGSCPSQSGTKVPCPVFVTLETAAARGLDFIAISDHNTGSQNDDLRELQPYFDRLLLIPAREMTTFWGHFNVFGITQFVDYRVSEQGGLDVNAILRDVAAKGGIASINHANARSGEACMGCGWTPRTPVDMKLFTGVEAVNGDDTLHSEFWDRQVAAGYRLTAVGGSDNHNATIPPGQANAIGRPTTAVETSELSVAAILKGIHDGRVFVDLTSSNNRLIDLDARAGSSHAKMGGDLDEAANVPIDLDLHVVGCTGATVHLLADGKEVPSLAPMAVSGDDVTLKVKWTGDGGRHWLRAEIRDSQGGLMLLSNPVYINFEQH
jgi:predicted metal-dependent phosphoesterase TrpH